MTTFSTRRLVIVAGGAAVIVACGIGVAAASASHDSDTPITGPALERAVDAALAETGGGTVTGTEVGDEDSYYEVEVTLENGSQVDVQLNRRFEVVGHATDRDDTAR
jgi:hypothetical protein